MSLGINVYNLAAFCKTIVINKAVIQLIYQEDKEHGDRKKMGVTNIFNLNLVSNVKLN